MGMEILHEDRDILVIAKAAGLLTIGTDGERERTAHAALLDYVRKGNPKSPHRVFIVHRLDRDTSGLLVFARSEEAKFRLQAAWPEVEKTYLAVVEGAPPKEEDTLSSYLAENSVGKVYETRDPKEGKLSHTRYRILERRGDRTVLEISLLTGRKNQIRVHLAGLGCPIVGDAKYGRADRKSKRLALHAWKLAFPHPWNGRRMEFETPPPASFLALRQSPVKKEKPAADGGLPKTKEHGRPRP
jgi:tRNA pseudouridine32 synthase/23S rRNA pseudouridine746 synthase/23S rRNA pseudouridine1911/1915/1917 synthase